MLCIGFPSHSQKVMKKKIPAEAITKLNSMYPSAKNVEWVKDGTIYIAEFTDEKVQTSVLFDKTGELKQVVQYLSLNELPKESQDYLIKYYDVKKLRDISKVRDAKGGITFLVEVKKGLVVFDEYGKFLRANKF